MNFHDVRFPTDISRGATGGPERRTDVVVLGSGHEERNARWADARRSYNAGYGVRTVDDLHAIVAFFEERRGQLYGFRWRDQTDFKSDAPSGMPTDTDQVIAVADGAESQFQLFKMYGTDFAPYRRDITKPVDGSVLVAVDGVAQVAGVAFDVNHMSGMITFASGHIPTNGATVTAGFAFDTPVRFATDRLDINMSCLSHGSIPSIPIVEVRV